VENEKRTIGERAFFGQELVRSGDVALNVDLTGYRCELWDLENRRPMGARLP